MRILLISLLCLVAANVEARLWMPSVFADHMVLQQNSEVKLWGWSTAAQEELTIKASWMNEAVKVKVFQGNWSVEISTPEAGGPFTIRVSGHETLEFTDVLIGEVWLLSGQSNMEWSANAGIDNAEEEILNANDSNIRFFTVPRHRSEFPQDDTYGEWEVCTPETMRRFSAAGYFFAREIRKHKDVPIGLIGSYWGGSSVETWMKEGLINSMPELSEKASNLGKPGCCPQHTVGELYNAMIHPLTSFPVAGALWYQGETNRQNPFTYYITFPLMIESWREEWGYSFPFYFVQLAPYKYSENDTISAAIVRDAQLSTMLNLKNAGMVVTNDIGNVSDIHPRNKQEVGRRLALWALARDYGINDIEYSGPVYQSMEVDKSKIIIRFSHVADGLTAKGKELTHFYIAGSDQVFHPAKAKISGNTVVVRSPEVTEPVAVRFAFSDTAEPNLFNSAGLPASAFRTDDWEIKTGE